MKTRRAPVPQDSLRALNRRFPIIIGHIGGKAYNFVQVRRFFYNNWPYWRRKSNTLLQARRFPIIIGHIGGTSYNFIQVRRFFYHNWPYWRRKSNILLQARRFPIVIGHIGGKKNPIVLTSPSISYYRPIILEKSVKDLYIDDKMSSC